MSGFPLEIGKLANWPEQVDFAFNLYVRSLIVEDEKIVGIVAENGDSGATEELRFSAKFVVAAGGIHSVRLLSESNLLTSRNSKLTFHLVTGVGKVSVSKDLLAGSGPGLWNPVTFQEISHDGEAPIHSNFFLHRISAVQGLSRGRLGRKFSKLKNAISHRWGSYQRCIVSVCHELPPRSDAQIASGGSSVVEISFLPQSSDWDSLEKNIGRFRETLNHIGALRRDGLVSISRETEWGSGGHFLCGTPAGDDEESVVNCDLSIRGTSNGYVLSSAVFPTALAANPTQTLVCLGLMLASKLFDDQQET